MGSKVALKHRGEPLDRGLNLLDGRAIQRQERRQNVAPLPHADLVGGEAQLLDLLGQRAFRRNPIKRELLPGQAQLAHRLVRHSAEHVAVHCVFRER